MKKLKNLFVLSLFLTGIVLTFPLVGQASGDDDQDLKLEWENFKREVEIDTRDSRVEISSILKEGDNKDKIEYQIRIDDEVRIELKYSKRSNSTEVSFKYRIEFDEIIEYIDNGTVGNGFQEGEEVSIYTIGDTGWNPFNHSVVVLNATLNETFDVFTATTSDGVLMITFKVASSLLELNSTILTPNSMKLDVEINNFPYNSTGSSLALKTKIETKFQQEIKDNTTEEQLGLKSNESEVSIGSEMDEVQGYYSWAETALADNQTISVHNSPLVDISNEETDLNVTEGEQSFRIFFSFLANDSLNIFWDPTFAVISTISVPSPPPTEEDEPTTTNPPATETTNVATTGLTETPTSDGVSSSNDFDTTPVPGFEMWFIFSIVGMSYLFRNKRQVK